MTCSSKSSQDQTKASWTTKSKAKNSNSSPANRVVMKKTSFLKTLRVVQRTYPRAVLERLKWVNGETTRCRDHVNMNSRFCSKLSRLTTRCTRKAMTTSVRNISTSFFCRILELSFINSTQNSKRFWNSNRFGRYKLVRSSSRLKNCIGAWIQWPSKTESTHARKRSGSLSWSWISRTTTIVRDRQWCSSIMSRETLTLWMWQGMTFWVTLTYQAKSRPTAWVVSTRACGTMEKTGLRWVTRRTTLFSWSMVLTSSCSTTRMSWCSKSDLIPRTSTCSARQFATTRDSSICWVAFAQKRRNSSELVPGTT